MAIGRSGQLESGGIREIIARIKARQTRMRNGESMKPESKVRLLLRVQQNAQPNECLTGRFPCLTEGHL